MVKLQNKHFSFALWSCDGWANDSLAGLGTTMSFDRQNFTKLRKERRWKTTQIAKECGVSRQSVNQWESGRANPSEENVRKLSHILEVPLSKISTFKDEAATSDLKMGNMMGTVLSYANATAEKLQRDYNELVSRAKKTIQKHGADFDCSQSYT